MRGALLTTFAVARVWAVFTVWWLAQPHALGFLPDPARLSGPMFQLALRMWGATLVVAASPSPRSVVRDRSSRTAWLLLPVATAVGAKGYAAGWGSSTLSVSESRPCACSW